MGKEYGKLVPSNVIIELKLSKWIRRGIIGKGGKKINKTEVEISSVEVLENP